MTPLSLHDGTMKGFCRYELRTTDVAAARSFYSGLLEDGASDITLLPEAAVARGARAHWLGHIAVEDLDATARAFTSRGATTLATPRATVAVLRDPGGAVVALTSERGLPRSDVVWHLLNAHDLERTFASYSDLFGWHFTDRLDLGALGVFHQFAWPPYLLSVGSMTDITQRPLVHPHWLFNFRVRALDPALAKVREAGGLVMGPFDLPGGERVAVCDDPQGAAFALRESPTGP